MSQRIRHFRGVESSEQLKFIDELHALGLSSTIDLPELIVVGDQNTGKSSVLQAITEVSFPVQDRTCTRFPIQISFRQTATNKNPGVKATINPGKITKEDEAFLERVRGFRVEKEDLSQESLKDIIEKATESMFGKDHVKGDTLCDATLRIERSGPDEMHWSIIDLPGLIRNSHTANKAAHLANGTTPNGTSPTSKATIAESIVREYLQNERNIVLLILGDSDVELSKSLEIVETVPGIKSRAIGVLNKCDKREEGAGDWMVSLLQNKLSTALRLDHGWFGLRNRKPNEPHFTDLERDEAEEREFAQPAWQDVPKDRFGVKALMDYVDRERRTQLQKGIPSIITEIRQKLRNCEDELRKLGEARTSARSQRFFVHQFCTEMQRMADACLRGQYQGISSDDPKIRLPYLLQQRLDDFTVDVYPTQEAQIRFGAYEEELTQLRSLGTNGATWTEQIKNASGIYSAIYEEAIISRGKSLPGSVHPDVEEKVFRKLSAHWERYAREVVEAAKTRVRETYDILLRLAVPNNRIRLEVSRVIGGRLESWNRDSDNALQELVDDNRTRPLFTKNPVFERQNAIAERQRNRIFNRAPSPVNGTSHEGSQDIYLPTLLNNILQTRARLETYYCIAVHRFIDNVATQVIERHVLGPKCPLRAVSAETFTQLGDDELNRVAGEDKADVSLRKRLETTRDSYQRALERWDQLSVL
ncbi:P-loop containing nucleoside triphosphate hydrolase protein [Aspergillus karnatakaensis]|uniref:putative dynamin family GTPase n=1 Tax=Aspergillus karnatakaensis TaxID=1810916 RepID=UPI003CCCC4B4